jgi:Flp pilus assembly protein TadG
VPGAATDRGQALVEFALIAVLFFTLLLGIIDGSRAIYAYNTVANAARVAARVAIVNQDPDAVAAAAIDEAVGLGLTEDDVVFANACVEKPCSIRVTVTYDFEAAAPFIDRIFDPTITSTAEMPLERVYP